MIIAILGIDGVGKSTIIDNIIKNYSGKKIIHFHFMPIKYSEKENNSYDFSNIKTYNLLISQIKILYLALKFYTFWIINITFSNYDLIIFDRIVFDAAIDPERYLLNKKTKGLDALFWFRKYIDKVFILHCDTEEILKRNNENTTKRIDYIQNVYLKVCAKFSFHKVNTNNKIPTILNKIYREINF